MIPLNALSHVMTYSLSIFGQWGLMAWRLLLMVYSTPYSFHILLASRTCSGCEDGTRVYLFVCLLFGGPLLENFLNWVCYSTLLFHASLFDFASIGMVLKATTNCALPLSQYCPLSLQWLALHSLDSVCKNKMGFIRLAGGT